MDSHFKKNKISSPRKFSEKIALHSKKMAEEQKIFDQVMRDLVNVTHTNYENDTDSVTITDNTSSWSGPHRLRTSEAHSRRRDVSPYGQRALSPGAWQPPSAGHRNPPLSAAINDEAYLTPRQNCFSSRRRTLSDTCLNISSNSMNYYTTNPSVIDTSAYIGDTCIRANTNKAISTNNLSTPCSPSMSPNEYCNTQVYAANMPGLLSHSTNDIGTNSGANHLDNFSRDYVSDYNNYFLGTTNYSQCNSQSPVHQYEHRCTTPFSDSNCFSPSSAYPPSPDNGYLSPSSAYPPSPDNSFGFLQEKFQSISFDNETSPTYNCGADIESSEAMMTREIPHIILSDYSNNADSPLLSAHAGNNMIYDSHPVNDVYTTHTQQQYPTSTNSFVNCKVYDGSTSPHDHRIQYMTPDNMTVTRSVTCYNQSSM